MSKWEYISRGFTLNKEDKIVKEHIQRAYPNWNWNDVPRFHPVILEAYLNELGELGWEVVSIEPVNYIGEGGDIGYDYNTPALKISWRRSFFCVFKRLKQ